MQNINTSRTFQGRWCGLILAFGLLFSSCADDSPTSIIDPFFVVDRAVPRAAPPGSIVTIYGENFSYDTTRIRVLVAGVQATVRSLEPSKIVITVPENARGQDIEIFRDGRNWVAGRDMKAAFQVIDSPYPFNGCEVDIDGVTAIMDYSYSLDDGYNKSWSDTSDLNFSYRNADFAGPDGIFCKEYTNGDTIRICSSIPTAGGARDGSTLEAVVDASQGLITRLELNQSWLSRNYQSPLQNETRGGGRRMILRNLPYTRLADGSLQVDVTGSHIFDYISSYESSYATSTVNESTWSNETRAVRRLIGGSDDAHFKLRLYKLR